MKQEQSRKFVWRLNFMRSIQGLKNVKVSAVERLVLVSHCKRKLWKHNYDNSDSSKSNQTLTACASWTCDHVLRSQQLSEDSVIINRNCGTFHQWKGVWASMLMCVCSKGYVTTNREAHLCLYCNHIHQKSAELINIPRSMLLIINSKLQ